MINIAEFEDQIEKFTEPFNVLQSEKNSVDNFSKILLLNECRKTRLQNLSAGWDRRSFFYAQDPEKIQNLSNYSCAPGSYQGEAIALQDLFNGPGTLAARPIVLTNNHLSYVLRTLNLGGLGRVRLMWDKFPWIIHDYDNHHWFMMSYIAQLIADFYVPAHPKVGLIFDNNLDSICQSVMIGSTQWPRLFIQQNADLIIGRPRTDEPLGRHHFYQKFVFRNRVIATLAQNYSGVGFVNAKEFHGQDELSRLNAWSGHKVHFVVPVSNDVPIRVFDAILTGGIPLVPRAIVPALDELNIPTAYYQTYGLEDLLNPSIVVRKAVDLFDETGMQGVSERLNYGLDHLHVDKVLDELVKRVDLQIQ